MLYSIDCKADIAEQDTTYPTYKSIDCDLHINANDDNFYGTLIDCDLYILTSLVTACTSWNQGIRLSVTINNIDVTSALVGNINITHNKNIASTFSLSLGDAQYSPHTNGNISLSKEVVITAYINGHEKKLITGIIDDIDMTYSPDININISGMDYSKKLLDKRTTIVSVQDLADSPLRNDIIKYLAEQAGITSVNIPEMDTVGIDNSFSDQTIWDMIQKEAIINLYWVRFNEEGVMELKLDEIKTDTTTYPTADWTYGEDRFTFLGLRKNESDIVNKIIILGSIYEKRIPTVEDVTDILNYRKNWSQSAVYSDIEGTDTSEDFSILIYCWAGFKDRAEYRVTVTWSDNDYEITDYSIAGDNIIIWSKSKSKTLIRIYFSRLRVSEYGDYESGALFVKIKGRRRDTYETIFEQISASITDPASINRYGERQAMGQESIEFPLIETQEQCKAIGKKIIRDSYNDLARPNFEIPFNPLLTPGQTIEITDKKIGFSAERWYVDSVSHNITINPVKGRTQVGCVYYAST